MANFFGIFGKRTKKTKTQNTPPNAQTRSFAAARLGRLEGQWLATEQSINSELQGDLNRLRARGRDLVKNNDYAHKFVGMCEDNIIGTDGIRLQSRVQDTNGKLDTIANKAIEEAWQDWGRACDVTGRLSFNDLCRNLVGSLPADGEFLVAMVRGSDAGNPYNFALQVIDVDRIDTSFNGEYGGNTVIMGVEVNAYRKPVALHLFTAHPSDGARSSRTRIRVGMDNLVHRFKLERAEQMRGIPWMASGMLSLHHLGNFKLSALLAAEHGANHYGFFERKDSDVVGIPIGQETADGGVEVESVQGYFDELPAGFEFKPFQSQYPNQVFGPFVKTTLQRIASGWRVAYHSLANDLEGVSFSSIRSGTLEERDRWRVDQSWFIGGFCAPVFHAWLEMALLSGMVKTTTGNPLPYSKYDKFKRHEWQPRAWEWVDPTNDMNAKLLAVNAGLMPPQDLAGAMGYDFEDNLNRIAEAQAMAREKGVNLPAYDSAPGANSGAGGSAEAAPNKGEQAKPKKTTAE